MARNDARPSGTTKNGQTKRTFKYPHYKYFVSLRWTDNEGHKYEMMTQLYPATGVYVAVYRDKQIHDQFGYDPARFGHQQRKQLARFRKAGFYVTCGTETTVTRTQGGLWTVVEREKLYDTTDAEAGVGPAKRGRKSSTAKNSD